MPTCNPKGSPYKYAPHCPGSWKYLLKNGAWLAWSFQKWSLPQVWAPLDAVGRQRQLFEEECWKRYDRPAEALTRVHAALLGLLNREVICGPSFTLVSSPVSEAGVTTVIRMYISRAGKSSLLRCMSKELTGWKSNSYRWQNDKVRK